MPPLPVLVVLPVLHPPTPQLHSHPRCSSSRKTAGLGHLSQGPASAFLPKELSCGIWCRKLWRKKSSTVSLCQNFLQMDTAPICLCLALSNLEHAYYIQHSSFEAKNPGRGEAESISSKGRGWWKGGAGANAATDLRIPDSFKPPPTPTLRQEGTPPRPGVPTIPVVLALGFFMI